MNHSNTPPRAFFAVPYREADERRRELWGFVEKWMIDHHPDWPVHTGSSPDGPFNRGAAINDAVRQADDDWEVVVISDADNVCDPGTLEGAARMARRSNRVMYPFECYMYLDEYSTGRFMADQTWGWASPEVHPQHTYATTVRYRHYSGIQVVSRETWERVGGFVELTGWGAEDAIQNAIVETFADGATWLKGAAYHLYHPANRNDPRDPCNVANHHLWAQVQQIVLRGRAQGVGWTANNLRRTLHNSIGWEIPE